MYKAIWKIVHPKNVRTNGENMKKLLFVISILVLFSLPLYAQTQGVHKEDRPHISGDDGVAVLFRRCDAVVSPSTATDGDYTIPCVDSNGNLRISGAITIDTTGLATSALQGGGLPTALGIGGGLKIDGSGTALPVSGTFWQSTQPVSGTFWQATQPVSIASMPSTPVTGTFWQATQPISGTITASQSTASSLKGQFTVMDGTGTANDGTHPIYVAPQTSGFSVTAAQGTATNLKAQAEAYQGGSAVAAANGLYVQPGTSAIFTAKTDQTTHGTTDKTAADLYVAGAVNSATNGAFVTPTTANTPFAVKTDQTTHGTTDKVAADLYQGGSLVAVGNGVYIQPGTGATPYSFVSTASANLTNVKASAGTLYSITVINPGATLQYVRFYDKATAPDPSACSDNSDCPVLYFPIPANADSLGGGFSIPIGMLGIAFANGIGYSISGAACTVVSTCTDETNAAAGVTIILVYK